MSQKTFEPIHLGPITVTFSVDAEMSNGTATVSRCDVPNGQGIPVPHFHDAFEETIYGIEGVTTFVIDGETVPVSPGDTLCIRRGQVHRFMADDGDAAFLAIATPGVFGEAYFLELADVLSAGGPPDPQAMGAVMLRHGLTPVAP
jgi:quercetin dioxygenase-like cupin family protein